MTARPTAMAMNTASSTVAGVVQGGDGLAAGGRDIRLEHGHLGAQGVEVRLAGQDVRADHGLAGCG